MNDAIALERRMASLNNALKPIFPLLENDYIVDIMLNTDGTVWADEIGKGMYFTDIMMSADAAERIIRLVAAAMGTEVHEKKPRLSGRLPQWGARVQATLPPIVSAPIFTLRKPSKIIFTLDDYVDTQVMTAEQAAFLTQAIRDRKTILIGGGVGTGKSTLINAFLQVIADTGERLYIIEDNVELQCAAKNKLEVLVDPPLLTWQQAIMDGLRHRPDRIIVGEVRDGISALEMLKAWNTGHPGGLATIHADNPAEMLDRLGDLIGEEKATTPYSLIARSIDLCVYLERDENNSVGRRLSGIVQVDGIDRAHQWLLTDVSFESSAMARLAGSVVGYDTATLPVSDGR